MTINWIFFGGFTVKTPKKGQNKVGFVVAGITIKVPCGKIGKLALPFRFSPANIGGCPPSF
ncbi:hypothetical protein [Synechococcus sp. C9]|uniref:hypothetical protein n=1 Tax=Synechococcus sp. C9 TaxID=102119 RepID=UPI001FF1C916|nr:hypothetical protein [Synechococcus sp. C9]